MRMIREISLALIRSRIDALVNAAGGFAMSGPLAGSDVAVWHKMIAINLTTAFIATRAFLPLLRAAKGSVTYLASEAALPGEIVRATCIVTWFISSH